MKKTMANYNTYLIAGGAILAGAAAYVGYTALQPQPKLRFNYRRPRDGKSQFHVFEIQPPEGDSYDRSSDDGTARIKQTLRDTLSKGDRVAIYKPDGTKAMEATVTGFAEASDDNYPGKKQLVEIDKDSDTTSDVASASSKQSPGYMVKLPLQSIF